MTDIKSLAEQLDLWPQIAAALDRSGHKNLLPIIAALPVRKSSATRSLGAYVSKAGQPLCIRLQFAQEEEQLRDTLLHEIAHACDHLSHQPGKAYRRAHGPGWRAWALALGTSDQRRGHSAAVAQLHKERLKLVAICQNCGAEFKRVRRLNRRRKYLHPACGGRIIPV
jgi:predicted SprT family Zn-dependent metalloprotease